MQTKLKAQSGSTSVFIVALMFAMILTFAGITAYAGDYTVSMSDDSTMTMTGSFDTDGGWSGTLTVADSTKTRAPVITVTVGGTVLPESDYSYRFSTGAISIPAAKLTGNVIITAMQITTPVNGKIYNTI